MRGARKQKGVRDAASAQALAERALLFLVQSPERLQRFLAETGISPADLRAQASEPGTLSAVLSYVLADESALLTFVSEQSIEPQDVHMAAAILSGEASGGDW